ncbi:MAG: MFS transporter [Gammaproteobacteria bacterium]|nr:MFS transporter [Gammaproteobacteria bacterium]MBT5725847.1 MFS transporter [Gammaproteobacteria bacterium]MBT7880206.1 MFS transporter [Gammaproteobacteria bacterium]
MISVTWPFDPKRSPVYYGWVVWLFSTVGFLLSIPGQTMGMAVFTEPFLEAFGLTRTQLSMAYLFGTIGSSLFLTQAGRWYDRLGGRIMIAASSLALGLMVGYISFVDVLSRWLGGHTLVTFILILLGFFGVRFFGQGVLTSCSRNVLMLWFVKRRGLVSGLRSVFVSFGFSLAPLVLAMMIGGFGWRGALWFMALLVGLAFAVLAFIFVRDNPVSCGLIADGEKPSDAYVAPVEAPSKSLAEARRSPVFWIYSMSLAMHAMFGTALTFHVVAIFGEAGLPRDVAFGYFFPAAICATAANLVGSYLVDKGPLKPFLIVMLVGFVVGGYGLINLDQSWGYWMLAAGFGTGGGLWGVTSNLAFIRFFGPLHLGEVSGFNTSISVFASAVGPFAFSLAVDHLGSYNVAAQICLAMLVVLLIAAIVLKQEEVTH